MFEVFMGFKKNISTSLNLSLVTLYLQSDDLSSLFLPTLGLIGKNFLNEQSFIFFINSFCRVLKMKQKTQVRSKSEEDKDVKSIHSINTQIILLNDQDQDDKTADSIDESIISPNKEQNDNESLESLDEQIILPIDKPKLSEFKVSVVEKNLKQEKDDESLDSIDERITTTVEQDKDY